MSKENKMPKEYAIIVSLIIFFAIVIFTGGIRLFFIANNLNTVDLSNIDILEENTNIDMGNYNIRIINSIRQKYNIDIYYGLNSNVESVDAVAITDDLKVFSMLKEINSMLETYPEDLIREIESKGYELSIYLVDYFNTNIEALANRNSIGQMKIYISNTSDITRALHHEWFHILDYYIRLESDEAIVYLDWNKYNPKDFKYTEDINKITSQYVYNGQEGAHFVTPYAKYSIKEDRAETFAEMIVASKDEVFFNEQGPIKGKMEIIKQVLRKTFQSIRLDNNLSFR